MPYKLNEKKACLILFSIYAEKKFAEATKNLQELQEKKDSFQSLEVRNCSVHDYAYLRTLLQYPNCWDLVFFGK